MWIGCKLTVFLTSCYAVQHSQHCGRARMVRSYWSYLSGGVHIYAHLLHGFLGLQECGPQMWSWSVRLFLPSLPLWPTCQLLPLATNYDWLFLCSSVCWYRIKKPHGRHSPIYVHVAYDSGLVRKVRKHIAVWSSSGSIAICYVLPVLWMTISFYITPP